MAYEGPHFGSATDYADYYESLWGEPPVYQAASSTAAAPRAAAVADLIYPLS